ncbi:MAG: ScpA family protein [Saprospiraceae bacterium]
MNEGYTIKLNQFEGPFDLLLFFIERDELDIHDIPIAKITDDFLAYVRDMESLNIDLASEFILVAATLMRIKAKMLIPRKPVDEEGNEIDPREELVQHLMEYKRYKSVLDDMRVLEEDRSNRQYRGNTSAELKQLATKALVDVELESLTLFKLMKAFEGIIRRLEDKKQRAVHQVFTYNHTIQGQQIFILTKVRRGEKTDFVSIFGGCRDRMQAIITFLGLLELLNMQKIHVIEREGINNFWLTIHEEEEEEGEAGEAQQEEE